MQGRQLTALGDALEWGGGSMWNFHLYPDRMLPREVEKGRLGLRLECAVRTAAPSLWAASLRGDHAEPEGASLLLPRVPVLSIHFPRRADPPSPGDQ